MKLSDIRDSNGTSIQSHAEVFADKLREQPSVTFVILLVHKPSKAIHTITNVDMQALPRALKELSHQMRHPAKGEAPVTEAEPS